MSSQTTSNIIDSLHLLCIPGTPSGAHKITLDLIGSDQIDTVIVLSQPSPPKGQKGTKTLIPQEPTIITVLGCHTIKSYEGQLKGFTNINQFLGAIEIIHVKKGDEIYCVTPRDAAAMIKILSDDTVPVPPHFRPSMSSVTTVTSLIPIEPGPQALNKAQQKSMSLITSQETDMPFKLSVDGYEKIFKFAAESTTVCTSPFGSTTTSMTHTIIFRMPLLLVVDNDWESHQKRIIDQVNTAVNAMWQSETISLIWKEDAQATGGTDSNTPRVYIGAILEITGNKNGKISMYPQFIKGRDMGCGVSNAPLCDKDGYLIGYTVDGYLVRYKPGADIEFLKDGDKILRLEDLIPEFLLSAQELLRRGGSVEGGKDYFNHLKKEDVRKMLEANCLIETGVPWKEFETKMQTLCDSLLGKDYDWISQLPSLGSTGNHYIELGGLEAYHIINKLKETFYENRAKKQAELAELQTEYKANPTESLYFQMIEIVTELAELIHSDSNPVLPKEDEICFLMCTTHSGSRKVGSDMYDALLALGGGAGNCAIMYRGEHIKLAFEVYDLMEQFALLNRALVRNTVLSGIHPKFGISIDPEIIHTAWDNVPYMAGLRKSIKPAKYMATKTGFTRGCVHNGAAAYKIIGDNDRTYFVMFNTKGSLVIGPESAAGIAGTCCSSNPTAPAYQFVANLANSDQVTKISLHELYSRVHAGEGELVTMSHEQVAKYFLQVPHGFGRHVSKGHTIAHVNPDFLSFLWVFLQGVGQSINPGSKGDSPQHAYKDFPTKYYFETHHVYTAQVFAVGNHKEGLVHQGHDGFVEMIHQAMEFFKPVLPEFIESVVNNTELTPLQKLMRDIFIGLDLILVLKDKSKNRVDTDPVFREAVRIKALIKKHLYPHSLMNGLISVL